GGEPADGDDPRRPADAGDARDAGGALRAQRVHAGGDLAHRLVRPVGRRAREAARAAHHPRARERDGATPPARQLDERAHPPPSAATHGAVMNPLYILPFDHRGSFQSGLFGWKGTLTSEQRERVAASKAIIYEGLLAAVAGDVPKAHTGILVDEQFGAAILRDARTRAFLTAAPA